MKSDVFIQQEITAGALVHCHQGVWWQTTALGVCKPLLPFQTIVPKDARPRRIKSFVGYSHLVPIGVPANRQACFWVIEGPELRAYGMDSLNHANRKAVAKAQRTGLTVSRITDLEPLWPDLREIAMSMAERTGYGLPAEYYKMHFEEWKQSFRREFSKPLREWWGVFSGGKLGAYMYAFHIDDTLYLQVTKVHSDFMPVRASDYLYFTMLEYARDLTGCTRVNTGRGRQSAGVDRFKEGHGFRMIEVGEYFTYNPGLSVLLRSLLRFHRRTWPSSSCQGQRGPDSKVQSLYRRAIKMAERIDSQEECVPGNDSDANHNP